MVIAVVRLGSSYLAKGAARTPPRGLYGMSAAPSWALRVGNRLMRQRLDLVKFAAIDARRALVAQHGIYPDPAGLLARNARRHAEASSIGTRSGALGWFADQPLHESGTRCSPASESIHNASACSHSARTWASLRPVRAGT